MSAERGGPRASDLLANERTFLAYLRTALSIVAFGFVVAKFALFTREIAGALHLAATTRRVSTAFGTTVSSFGALVALYGGWRFVATQRALARGDGRAAEMPAPVAAFAALAVALVGIATAIALVAVR